MAAPEANSAKVAEYLVQHGVASSFLSVCDLFQHVYALAPESFFTALGGDKSNAGIAAGAFWALAEHSHDLKFSATWDPGLRYFIFRSLEDVQRDIVDLSTRQKVKLNRGEKEQQTKILRGIAPKLSKDPLELQAEVLILQMHARGDSVERISLAIQNMTAASNKLKTKYGGQKGWLRDFVNMIIAKSPPNSLQQTSSAASAEMN